MNPFLSTPGTPRTRGAQSGMALIGETPGGILVGLEVDEVVGKREIVVRPAHPESYEHVFHESAIRAGIVHLRAPLRHAVRDELETPRLERAIGVVYRPDTELQSHYFRACLPLQFDEWIWFDESRAVRPLSRDEVRDLPREHPFAW